MAQHDYERDTRRYYQDSTLAGDYHQRFTRWRGLRSIPLMLVAHFERQAVRSFLLRVPHGQVLDIPAGTGKLAPVFRELGSQVTSCDISAEMLELAKEQYSGYDRVEFRVCEAEKVGDVLQRRFEAAVCLRLLHLVPPEVQERILSQLAGCADHLVVSFGVDSEYHRLRRRLRARLFGGDPRGTDCHEPLGRIVARLGSRFKVLGRRWVMPGLSAEVVLLLEPRDFRLRRVEFVGLPGAGKSTLARGLSERFGGRARITAPGSPGAMDKLRGAFLAAGRHPGLLLRLGALCRRAGSSMGASLAVHWLECLQWCRGGGFQVMDQGLAQLLWALVYFEAPPDSDRLEALLGPAFGEPVAVVFLEPDRDSLRVPDGRLAGGVEYRFEEAVAALSRTRELLEELAGRGYPVRVVDFANSHEAEAVDRLGRDLSLWK